MSLIDDLKGLDLSSIKDARGGITASVSGGDIQALVSGGATQAILGELGSAIESVTGSFAHPEDLLKPLMAGMSQLTGSMSSDKAPTGDFMKVVEEGIGAIATLLTHLQLDPQGLGSLLETFVGQAVSRFPSQAGSAVKVGLGDLEDLIKLVETVEAGLPADASAFTDLTLTILIPTGGQGLLKLRESVSGLLQGARAIQLPATRSSGLLDLLASISASADAGDLAAVQRGVSNLDSVRSHTVEMIAADIVAVTATLDRLPIASVIGEVAVIAEALAKVDNGVLEYMHGMKAELALIRKDIENVDSSQIAAQIDEFLDKIEQTATELIVAPIESLAQNAVDFLTAELSKIPIGKMRDDITAFINSINDAIKSANLDQYANDVRDALNKVKSVLGDGGLGADIQQTITKVELTITNALDPIISALTAISSAINTVAGEAKAILEKVADALEAFKKAVDEITTSVQNIGVEQAAQQVVDALDKLRTAAQQLLSSGSLPDALKPVVQQLIDAVKDVDLDAVMKPIQSAADSIKLPDDVGAAINDGIATASDALKHLIPASLIADLEKEVTGVLDTIKNFNPASLLPDITQYLKEAADKITQLDPSSMIDQLHPEFQKVLDAIDAVNPTILLAPAFDIYDKAMSAISISSAEDALQMITDAISSSGGSSTQALTSPLSSALPSDAQANAPSPAPAGSTGAGSGASAGAGSGSGAGAGTGGALPPNAPSAADVPQLRPGDLIRVFGYLPSRLREAVSAMDQGVVGDVLARIDSVTGALARDLRLIQASLWQIEDQLQSSLNASLSPLHAAQFKAQLSVQAHVGAPGFDAKASLDTIVLCGPDQIRAALKSRHFTLVEQVRQTADGVGGSAGVTLGRAAAALEGLHLAGVGNSLENLLAALDPEPIAAEFDAIVHDLLLKAPDILSGVVTELKGAVNRLMSIISDLNPGRQAQRFLRVLDVLHAQLDILNPRRLAAELGEVHATIRAVIAAYDPAIFAAEIAATIKAVADGIIALNPATLLGNVNILSDAVNKVEDALPSKVLDGVGAELTDVGNRLLAINPDALITALNQVPGELAEALTQSVDLIKQEILALLNSLQYSSANAGASVTVHAGA